MRFGRSPSGTPSLDAEKLWLDRRDRTTGDFPRWRSYGDKGRGAAKLRLCDREGCSEIGDRPAPKAPHSSERWYFCEAHASEYNKNWNYFAGLSPEEAARRATEEETGAKGFRHSAQWQWAGPGTAPAAAMRCGH